MGVDAVDLAGAVMGTVEESSVLGPDRVEDGDLVVGLHSPNLRSNGFSLVRAVLGDEISDHSDSLLEPSVIYSPSVLSAAAGGGVHSAAHITGGGLAANLSRALPEGLGALIDVSSWERPEIFDFIASHGVSEDEMRLTFNLGVGFCLVVSSESLDEVLEATAPHSPVVIGRVTSSPGVVLE